MKLSCKCLLFAWSARSPDGVDLGLAQYNTFQCHQIGAAKHLPYYFKGCNYLENLF